ncbi:MAG: B12-binding domain-containing radical SAM protein, partial [bacterium]|nr:B12-binding domain-containing radical SAM protein [bacterium]
MKIYLIKPRFPVTYWGFEYSNDLSGATYTSPPLSLATIAALTPSDIEVDICDENIEEIDFEKECDLVGLTAYLMQGPHAFRIAEEFRKRGKPVALGGPITGLNLEGCRGKADVLFVGEAEYTWPKFLDDYRRGSYQPEYVQTEKIDIRDSPVPRMDLLKLDKYVHAAIQTTRGCPFGCEFCDIVVLFGRKVRSKSVEQVIAELREAVKQPICSIFFTDDNFIGNKRYAKELLLAIIEFNNSTKIPMGYMTQVSINLAQDEELLDLLSKANVSNVFIGIETPRKSSLQEVNKGQNVRTDLLEDVKKIQSYNISVSAGMIVGFDHDDERIFQEQLDFIMEANIPWAMTGILQAVPKTPLYKRLKREQRLDLASEYFEVDNTALDVNIVPKSMSKERLVQGYTWLVRQLYTHDNYAKRVIGSILNYSQRTERRFARPTRWQLKVVLRAVRYYLLTLDRKRRTFFWKIMSATLRHRPSAIVDAMTYVVSFKHLHTYVNTYLEKVLNQKAVADASPLPTPAADSEHRLENAYHELRKHTFAISAQAAFAYEELRRQLSQA